MLDYLMGLDTPKLNVPENFAPTNKDRGWVINPFGKNPPYLWVAAVLPALLATILIFMDQQITAVIVNRKENKLKVNEIIWIIARNGTFLRSFFRKDLVITLIC